MNTPTLWTALLPVLVPVVIAALKLLLPRLPTWLLPILAPLLGAAADLAMHYAGLPSVGAPWGAILGSAGVGLREIQDQVRKAMGARSD